MSPADKLAYDKAIQTLNQVRKDLETYRTASWQFERKCHDQRRLIEEMNKAYARLNRLWYATTVSFLVYVGLVTYIIHEQGTELEYWRCQPTYAQPPTPTENT